VPFHVTARRRYLNYAISVITARALPDVRDGLKPVQRRILYTMQNDLHLGPAAKPLKCARIVGDVLGKYHPHGDAAVYEALVRMAQDFSLRYPLIDGHGNFGSLDGDSPAAYRYTEARLRPLSMELLAELLEETVDFRANYDGRTREPAVLPARLPNLLLNGATGIAVGMATNIPPHNLTEVALACEALIDDRDASVADLMKHVKGPDFPTGGQILNSRADLRKIYEDGQGSIRVRAEYTVEGTGRGMPRVIITSIPYMVQKDVLVRAIADIIFARKVPQLVDVRDESTADVRIVCELKKDADPALVMAYLYKHTQLQANFNVNLTCLVPGATPPDSGGAAIPVSTPARVDLKTILSHFLDFRYQVVERRFRHELKLLLDRIHILEGFRKVFNALDEAIRIIRGADGREDAAEKLKERFKLDDAQAAAILDLRLYKLAKLEIKAILDELREKKARVEEIEAILKSSRKLWGVVKDELKEAREKFADERRTKVGGRDVEEVEYDEEAFIVDEDAHVILSRDGWVRRVGRVGDIAKARLRPDDEVLGVAAGNTKSTVVFFSNLGFAYTVRLNDIPPSRGYGEPLPSLFKFRDGERAIAVLSLDPRVLADIGKVPAAEEEEEASPRKKGKKGKQEAEPEIPGNHAFVVSSSGYTSRFGLAAFAEPSTRAGRKFLRVREGEEVAGVHAVTGGETAVLATRKGRVTLFPVAQVNFLSGPGRGVRGIKCAKDDRVIGSVATADEKVGLVLVRPNGNEIKVSPSRYRTASRGGKGVEVVKRGGLARVKPPEIAIP
jgi:DNA gyrase subunit A